MSVLLTYTADLEARLGVFWQSLSGSPAGLPRVYVSEISAAGAWKSFKSACDDLGAVLLRNYQLSMEVAEMIATSPLECPDRIPLWALRNRRLVVGEAAFQAIRKKIAVKLLEFDQRTGRSGR